MEQLITHIPYAKRSFFASVVVFFITIFGFMLVGSIYSDTQARGLIEAMNPALQTLCFAVITSASTIIPLLLTILSLADRVEKDFDETFYRQVRIIAILGTTVIVSALLLLLFLTIPLTESDQLRTWFSIVYYIIIGATGWVAGLLVGIVMTLYTALMGVIQTLTPKFEDAESGE